MRLNDVISAPEPMPTATDRHKEYQLAFGRRLRKLRKLFGYTQEQLAQKCSKDRTTITNIETGHQAISIHTFVEICECEQLAADIVIWLLTGNETPDLEASAFGCPTTDHEGPDTDD